MEKVEVDTYAVLFIWSIVNVSIFTQTNFTAPTFCALICIQFKIYTQQNLYGSKCIQLKIYSVQNKYCSKWIRFKILWFNIFHGQFSYSIQLLHSHINIIKKRSFLTDDQKHFKARQRSIIVETKNMPPVLIWKKLSCENVSLTSGTIAL
jgi:hypothetical protein